MPDESPWRRNPPQPAAQPSGIRFLIWLVLLIAGGASLLALMRSFPGWGSSDFSKAYLIRGVAILVLVSAVIVFGRRIPVREALRNGLIWLGVLAVLAIGFTYQDELRTVAMRVRSELIPGYPVSSDARQMVLTQSDGGNFYVYGKVNGTAVKFLIDTGASDIVLSPADATHLGIDVSTLDFKQPYATANGFGLGAPYTVQSLSIGALELFDVPVSINKADMGQSLLGMTFLRHMASVEIRGRQLILHWRQ